MSLPQPVIDISPDGSYSVLQDVYHVSAWPVSVCICAGFRYDGASIPKLARPYIGGPWDPRRLPAATVHDWLYASHAVPKWLADLVFGYLLYRNEMGLWRSIVDWWAVSRFGHAAWHSHLPEEQALMIGKGRIIFFNTKKERQHMMHMIITIALAAIISVLAGCTSSTRIEWGGKMAVRQPDGTVLVDANGTPHYESEKNVYKDSNWLTKREERDVKVKVNADGSYEAGIGSRVNDVSTNGIAMVTGGLDATTKLVSTCAAAYVTIAGGGAQADTATALASKLVSYFVSKGGDADKATVSTDAASGTLTVTDGTTSVQCKDGACSTVATP